MKLRQTLLFALLAVGLLIPSAHAESTQRTLSEIAVQHSGRIKPFETFAKEITLYVLGRTKYEGIKSTELVWRWMVEPEKWNDKPMLAVHGKELQEEFSVMLIKKKISPQIVLNHQPFLDSIRPIILKREDKEKLTDEEKHRVDLYEKAYIFRQIGEGLLPGWVANPGDESKKWLSFQEMLTPQGSGAFSSQYDQAQVLALRTSLESLFKALREDFESEESQTGAVSFAVNLKELLKSKNVILNNKVLSHEITYNNSNPFGWAWRLYMLSFLVLMLGAVVQNLKQKQSVIVSIIGFVIFAAGFILHTYGFYLRSVISGRPPVTNMYESVVWVSWSIALFAIFLFVAYRSMQLMSFAAIVATVCLIVAQSFPALMDPFISPLVPVLRSNLWLTVHVLTITLSYGAFALAWGLGHGAVYSFAFHPKNKETQKRLTLFLYRSVQIGVVLLAAGTVLGGVWANYSWGRFWGWDPKETWALIALLGYVVVLHGRFSGWLTPFRFSVGVIVAFLGIIMAWYGVNYVLAAGLHSYGFGGGGAGYVLLVVLADLILVSLAGWKYSLQKKKRRSS